MARVLDALNAVEAFGSLPVAGGYLNQPITFMRDIQTAKQLMKEGKFAALEVARAARMALSDSAEPNVPLPPVPKELLHAL